MSNAREEIDDGLADLRQRTEESGFEDSPARPKPKQKGIGISADKAGDFLSALSSKEIKQNCSICNSAAKIDTLSKAVEIFKYPNRVTCKRCLVQIAKRKYAFQYAKFYIKKFNKKYFTVENIRRFIEEQWDYADLIGNFISNIIRDLRIMGVVGIYNQQYNGHRYVVLDATLLDDPDVEMYATLKGYGFKDGVKKTSIEIDSD